MALRSAKPRSKPDSEVAALRKAAASAEADQLHAATRIRELTGIIERQKREIEQATERQKDLQRRIRELEREASLTWWDKVWRSITG